MTKHKKSPHSNKIYAFIDSQNLNLGVSKDIYIGRKLIYKGWRLDYKKFRIYLADKFRANKAYLFIGFIPQNQALMDSLTSYGYEVIFKPTTKDHQGKPKGNAVIVSGDGDFYCLHKYLEEHNKLLKIVIPNAKSESSLLKPFQKYKVFIEHEKAKLEYESTRNGRRHA